VRTAPASRQPAATAPETTDDRPDSDPRARRRADRREQNRSDILDAAERVFGEDGIHEGSLRRIAAESGFSAGAVYLFFENKQDLLTQTLIRRGDELSRAVGVEAAMDTTPMARLHRIIDVAVDLFAQHPHFRQLFSRMSGGTSIAGPLSASLAEGVYDCFTSIMSALAGLIEEGQAVAEIRQGDPMAMAQLFSVLLNEFVLLGANPSVGVLTAAQFHGLVDGAFRGEGVK